MTDPRSAPRPRGLRLGAVSVLVMVVLLAGLFVGILLGRRAQAPEASVEPSALTQPGTAPIAAPPPAAPPAPVDAATLAGREAMLSGQLAALEQRTAALTATADAAGTQAGRAEALLAALSARRVLDRGLPLGALDTQLLQRFGNIRAVAIVRLAARQPVTLEDLRQGLDAIGPAAAAGTSEGWASAIRRELGTLVVLRRAGTPSPRPVEHLARARRLLDQGQVEAARAEVLLLPGAQDAAAWLTAAHRYVLARQALDALEATALSGPVPAPAPPSSPPATSRL